MAVKDWIPVAQDIYDALVADGKTKQGKTLKISHKDLCEILDNHNIAVTEAMNKPIDKIEETSIVYIIRTEVRCKDLSKSLHENGLFINDLTDDEERSAYSSYNIPRSLWIYQIAHRLKFVFGDPKEKEEAIKDKEEIADDCVTEDVKSTKHDKIIKICSEIIEIRKKFGFVPMPDLAAIVGKEFFSNETTNLFAVPRDKRYIEALRILNNISLIVNTTFGLEELVKLVEDQFDRLDTIAIADGSFDEDKQFNLVLQYLYSIKKSNLSKSISYNELLKAFVIGNIIDNGSDYIFIPGESIKRFLDFIDAENFDIKDKDQVCACKYFLRSIKQTVLLNKENNNKFNGFMMSMASMESSANSSDSSISGTTVSQKSPTIQEIDQKIYKKAAAFDKLVEALRPIFDELTN